MVDSQRVAPQYILADQLAQIFTKKVGPAIRARISCFSWCRKLSLETH